MSTESSPAPSPPASASSSTEIPSDSSTDAGRQSIFIRAINTLLTPLTFISFLVSLALVDRYHQLRRYTQHYHASQSLSTRLPPWLHHLLYRPQPYQWVRATPVAGPGEADPGVVQVDGPRRRGESSPDSKRVVKGEEQTSSKWFYHSKQRKLMKMEADEAFEIRGVVMLMLALGTAGLSMGVYSVCRWVWYRFVL